MKYWTVAQSPMRKFPGSREKILDIPIWSVVEETGADVIYAVYNGQNIPWHQIVYREFVGWVYGALLEQYRSVSENIVPVEIPTPISSDPAQYIVWEGKTKHNLCGEFCVAHVVEEKSIEEMLRKWKMASPEMFARVVNRDKPTGVGELVDMLKPYNCFADSLTTLWTDPVLKRVLFTPGRVSNLLKNGYQIVLGVKIDGYTGGLRGGGIGHWVTIDAIIPIAVNRALVTIYNPFVNQLQDYSFDEIVKSAGSIYGIAVSKR